MNILLKSFSVDFFFFYYYVTFLFANFFNRFFLLTFFLFFFYRFNFWNPLFFFILFDYHLRLLLNYVFIFIVWFRFRSRLLLEKIVLNFISSFVSNNNIILMKKRKKLPFIYFDLILWCGSSFLHLLFIKRVGFFGYIFWRTWVPNSKSFLQIPRWLTLLLPEPILGILPLGFKHIFGVFATQNMFLFFLRWLHKIIF